MLVWLGLWLWVWVGVWLGVGLWLGVCLCVWVWGVGCGCGCGDDVTYTFTSNICRTTGMGNVSVNPRAPTPALATKTPSVLADMELPLAADCSTEVTVATACDKSSCAVTS